jgi:hypothetical protein
MFRHAGCFGTCQRRRKTGKHHPSLNPALVEQNADKRKPWLNSHGSTVRELVMMNA